MLKTRTPLFGLLLLGFSMNAFAHEECQEGPRVVRALEQIALPGDWFVCTDTVVRGSRFSSTVVVFREGYIQSELLFIEGKLKGKVSDSTDSKNKSLNDYDLPLKITGISSIHDLAGSVFPTEIGHYAHSVRVLPSSKKALILYKNSRAAIVDFTNKKAATLKEIVNLSNPNRIRTGEIIELEWRNLEKDGLKLSPSKRSFEISVIDETKTIRVCETQELSAAQQKGICDTVAQYGPMLDPEVLKRYTDACTSGRLERCSDQNPIRRMSFSY